MKSIDERFRRVFRAARYALPATATGFVFLFVGLRADARMCFPIAGFLIGGSLLAWILYAAYVGTKY